MVDQAATETEADWVRGVGWSDLESGYQPTCQDLDAMGLERPVIAVHYSYHQCVVSSAGLDALGISATTPTRRVGASAGSPTVSPNGLLVERAFSEAQERSMAPYLDDRWADLIVAAAHRLWPRGLPASMTRRVPRQLKRSMGPLSPNRRLPLGVVGLPHPAALLSPSRRSRLEGAVTGEGDHHLAVGTDQAFADGGVLPAITGTWHGQKMSMGLVFEGLADQVRVAVEAGFRVAVHAIGNAGWPALSMPSRPRPGPARRRPPLPDRACIAATGFPGQPDGRSRRGRCSAARLSPSHGRSGGGLHTRRHDLDGLRGSAVGRRRAGRLVGRPLCLLRPGPDLGPRHHPAHLQGHGA